MYKFELCQCHLSEFLKSNVNMTLEHGSIHFCSQRSNKNTKAFCVVQHGIRSVCNIPLDPVQLLKLKLKYAAFPAGH